MSDGDETAKGGCLCGAVRYEVSGPLRPVVSCHCGQCLKYHGHYAAYSAAPTEAVGFTEDRGLTWFRSSDFARRGFCGACGSSLFWQRDDSGRLSIAAGSFDDPSRLRTVRHIFVEDKADYYEIADGLEQLPRGMG